MAKKIPQKISRLTANLFNVDDLDAGLIKSLFRSDLVWIARFILRIVRLKWHHRPLRAENESNDHSPLPTGPYLITRKEHVGDLLLWVPRRMESYLIDELTGGYGYSHSTIDSGEIDLLTGKPVMIEVTIGQRVTRKFQDQYQQRPFVRVPLSKTGVNVDQFMDCVKSKMGEPYDNLEIFTLGKVHDPAKEVCSGLAADCLPEKELQRIAEAKRMGLLHHASVSINSKPESINVAESISPNGFAQYYGAPKGRKLNGPDISIDPQPNKLSNRLAHPWKVTAGMIASAVLLFALFSK